MKYKHHIIPIFVPHVGCPHDCVFCNQRKITGISTDITSKEVDNTIKSYLETIPKSNDKLEVAFYGGSFTAIDIDIQENLLKVAYQYKSKGLIDTIRLSTRPDCINIEALKLLEKYSVDIIELGVQSLDQKVLDQSNRGHNTGDVYQAVDLIREFQFELGLQMMIGLPGDSEQLSIETARKIIDIKPDIVRIYPTLVVKDTYLEKLYLEKLYIPLSVDRAVEISTVILMMFECKDINVIRIGLQPTRNISQDSGEVVSGPFHPSFRQLVESEIYAVILQEVFEGNLIESKDIIIDINKKEISNIVGQNKRNINTIKEKYKLRKISINGIDIPKEVFFLRDGENKHIIDKKTYIEKHLKARKL